MTHKLEDAAAEAGKLKSEVGYRRPPVATRFKPGQSGNPKGRARGSVNLQTMFNKILNERVSMREGTRLRKVSKAEAILRGIVVNAMKGDPRAIAAMFKVAEQSGQFQDAVQQIVVSWKDSSEWTAG
jgi:Family of unknown function (DUF5681)